MADFLSNLWESVFTAGPTPTLLVATNVTFGALQVLLFGLLAATRSIHFAILSVLCGGLWYSINWFARELAAAQAKEEEAERLRKRKNSEQGRRVEDEADDEGEDTETEGGLRESTASLTSGGPTRESERVREDILDAMRVPPPPPSGQGAASSGAQAGTSEARLRQTRVDEAGISGSELSTDSEWEKVDEGR